MGRAAVAAEMVVHLNAIAQKGKWPNGSRQIGKKKKKALQTGEIQLPS